jgi:hypothetical protein
MITGRRYGKQSKVNVKTKQRGSGRSDVSGSFIILGLLTVDFAVSSPNATINTTASLSSLDIRFLHSLRLETLNAVRMADPAGRAPLTLVAHAL